MGEGGADLASARVAASDTEAKDYLCAILIFVALLGLRAVLSDVLHKCQTSISDILFGSTLYDALLCMIRELSTK